MQRTGLCVAAAISVLVGAAGLSGAREAAPLPPVVIIVVDTLRADHLGCYGYFRPTSPHIDAFAADSTLFTRAMTPIGTTLPAHVSLFTSTNPSRHGVRGNYEFFHVPVPSDGKLLLAAQMFGRMGYRTAGFVSSPAVSKQTGIGAGFETYSDQPLVGAIHTAVETTDRVVAWLDQVDARPFFLFVHYVDPHSPFAAPEPYRNMFKTDDGLRSFLAGRGVKMSEQVLTANNGYDGEIRYTDEQIGRLLDKLREKGLYDRAAIVFTSDHGEGLGQHGWLYHSRIYNEQMLVPLIIRLPGKMDSRAKRVDGLVSLIDVLPTLAANLDLPLIRAERSQFEGVDVLGGKQREYVFAERTPHHKADPERDEYYALVSADWKLFLRPRGQNQLFDLRSDRVESTNVIASQPDVAEGMLEDLDDQLDEYDKSVEGLEEKPKAQIGEDVRERMRQLGYDMP